MRKTGPTILVLLLGVAVAVLAAAPGTAAAARPSLRLLGMSPLTVRGLHFKPGEGIRVVATIQGVKLRRQARANTSGAFTVGFGAAPAYDPCGSSLILVAVGSLGSKALLKLPPRECAPLRSPP